MLRLAHEAPHLGELGLSLLVLVERRQLRHDLARERTSRQVDQRVARVAAVQLGVTAVHLRIGLEQHRRPQLEARCAMTERGAAGDAGQHGVHENSTPRAVLEEAKAEHTALLVVHGGEEAQQQVGTRRHGRQRSGEPRVVDTIARDVRTGNQVSWRRAADEERRAR